MQTLIRPSPKTQLIKQFKNSCLTEEMKAKMAEYYLSLHGVKESTKQDYLSKIKLLGISLSKHGIRRVGQFREERWNS